MNNKQGEELTVNRQYLKLKRAINIVLSTEISEDDYLAIIQLMQSVDVDSCLLVDNTYENMK